MLKTILDKHKQIIADDQFICGTACNKTIKNLYADLEGLKPVAYRVKDFADGSILCHTLAEAQREAESAGNLIEPLFA